MSKHTPGPWRVETETTLVWGACNSDDQTTRGMGYPIADCRTAPSGSWASGPSEDEGEANARLIAAAPDLLAALHDAQARLRGAGMLGGDDDPVNAAIAKAEGGR